MKLSIALPIIAFTGLFGYGSYREASDACDKWSASGREIQYQRPYTESEILEIPEAKKKINSDRQILMQELALLKNSQKPEYCKLAAACTPYIDDEYILKKRIFKLERNTAANMIQKFNLAGSH